MAYQIGDKTYTDHPMLDEIVYNCKKILRSIVIKNDVYALDCETTNSITYADAYYMSAQSQAKKGNFQHAIDDVKEAIKLSENKCFFQINISQKFL